ncbi:MFS transporter [Sphaerobacter sp.]|uniref:MFS transporter n=1 Tax=Sphaerobacter sp. TaxID=2099654 RepID=UPI001D3263AF|nr:MFS transporter [Sphaerobacter sp.]MBX5445834.1 MHS family MFS transporter [Sphaerobacter sp.]
MSSGALSASTPADRRGDASIFRIIGASAVGTMIEWYDFYIFGSLAAVISLHFYPSGNQVAALLATLATFGAGFAARPFGALFFGRIGDLVGRKYAFLVTLLIMGGATFVIGLLPGYGTIGIFAPILLVTIRVLQGLALGGEYGGAAVYVAEHVPDNKRGFYTSFIQTTATLGLFLSLLVILAVRESMSQSSWESWGWRVPFLLSIFLVAVSLFIRLRLKESPLFTKIKDAGQTSKAPVMESFGSKAKWQTILLVLWGAAAGQAVVWYTGQFYTLSWLQNESTAGVPFVDTNWIVAIGLALGTPFFIVFGALSDRFGRKTVMMAGNLLAAIFTIPVFVLMRHNTPAGGDYNPVVLIFCVFVLVLFVTMVYGPIAAFLVESFPARVRYTSVSLPYHIGNGYFGGFLPLIATALVVAAQDNSSLSQYAPYVGLIYPVTVAAITFIVGSLLLRETKDNTIEGIETRQRGYSPAIFGSLVGLTIVALVAADQFLMPTLNTETLNVQWFFRILALLVVVISAVVTVRHRRIYGIEEQEDLALEGR